MGELEDAGLIQLKNDEKLNPTIRGMRFATFIQDAYDVLG